MIIYIYIYIYIHKLLYIYIYIYIYIVICTGKQDKEIFFVQFRQHLMPWFYEFITKIFKTTLNPAEILNEWNVSKCCCMQYVSIGLIVHDVISFLRDKRKWLRKPLVLWTSLLKNKTGVSEDGRAEDFYKITWCLADALGSWKRPRISSTS